MRCPQCKSEFTKNRPWQKYCSDKCGQSKRNRKRVDMVRQALRERARARKMEAER